MAGNLQNRNIWLPDMDSNHDKQFQRLLCYRYTIRQRPKHLNHATPGIKPA